ncbi:unnamed protein product [Clavelina lepadiformis]|uniref:Uncharacterized protein n=1 Tax=Clavelina lepadiformis TaxID=159417 RepID=A0ABP0G3B0_CLALP
MPVLNDSIRVKVQNGSSQHGIMLDFRYCDGLPSQKHAMQQLFQRTQGFDKSVRNFLEVIAQMGKMAYPNDEQHEMCSSVLYNLLVRGEREIVNKPLI